MGDKRVRISALVSDVHLASIREFISKHPGAKLKNRTLIIEVKRDWASVVIEELQRAVKQPVWLAFSWINISQEG